MAEYLHELRPRRETDRLGIIEDVLSALDDAPFQSPTERAEKFEALLKLKGYQVLPALPVFPERAIR